MSTPVVEASEVKAVDPRSRADALEFITVQGWPVIVPKALDRPDRGPMGRSYRWPG